MQNKGLYAQNIRAIVEVLRKSERILFISGAGLSAESGLPTYRGIGGLYNGRLTDLGLPIEEVLSGQMMRENPELTWHYLTEIEQASRNATFNPAHKIIAEMEKHFPRSWVLTQNVDGFHQLAGSKNVIDIHGNMRKLYCAKCGFRIDDVDYLTVSIPPKCPDCQSIMRPDVVFFGEYLDEQKTRQLSAELAAGFDMIFSVGTSSLFPYIYEPVLNTVNQHTYTVEINPSDTIITAQVSVKLSTGAVQALRDIWELYLQSGASK